MDEKTYYSYRKGFLELVYDDTTLKQIRFATKAGSDSTHLPKHIQKTIKDLDEYFEGKRKKFDIPEFKLGTSFQQNVWKKIAQIPYGKTKTYGEIAKELGRPGSARAVGGACHENPYPIIIPCHRVVGKDGKLTGFGGGIDVKEWLIQFEQDKE